MHSIFHISQVLKLALALLAGTESELRAVDLSSTSRLAPLSFLLTWDHGTWAWRLFHRNSVSHLLFHWLPLQNSLHFWWPWWYSWWLVSILPHVQISCFWGPTSISWTLDYLAFCSCIFLQWLDGLSWLSRKYTNFFPQKWTGRGSKNRGLRLELSFPD